MRPQKQSSNKIALIVILMWIALFVAIYFDILPAI
jgi:hypothetical protein